ncbi:MAG: flagellar basal body rod protein FlgC [Desulfurivibrionaceae bacterium]|jgi:flagellar basal-body rod protein FlgC|nr:flagellar basal body protein [Pseudomonadota bacterium]MCG2823186.1 flagellar basal body protein [Desulfobulbaceae bacterium]MDP2001609.1 flagellar basal body rod C-terminal domain-containing protein [Desulfurivibrionaceae bacterium]PKN16654.1 MAG: flagellar biosynthesis protein FlgC [Deltaproteobacteria bacterium HGW-Deltaproteobacteria-3]MBU4407632.1 flagellar basal body protein [Pseudomonadota bacterium]
MISGIHSALSGLTAIQKKIESNANNVANINTDGYKKTRVTLQEQETQGVEAVVQQIQTPGPMVYEQTSQGETLVEKSNVELSEELPNMMLSRRFFQANLKTVQIQDEMLGNLLDIKS